MKPLENVSQKLKSAKKIILQHHHRQDHQSQSQAVLLHHIIPLQKASKLKNTRKSLKLKSAIITNTPEKDRFAALHSKKAPKLVRKVKKRKVVNLHESESKEDEVVLSSSWKAFLLYLDFSLQKKREIKVLKSKPIMKT